MMQLFFVTWAYQGGVGNDGAVVEASDEKQAVDIALEAHRHHPTALGRRLSYASARAVVPRQEPGIREATFPLPEPGLTNQDVLLADGALYFGVWKGQDGGHYLRAQNGRRVGDDAWGSGGDRKARRLDGGWCPADRDPGDPFGSGQFREAPEGDAGVGTYKGWTLLAWWDRSGDDRSASNSVILMPGVPNDVLGTARRAFPWVFERIETRTGRPVRIVEKYSPGNIYDPLYRSPFDPRKT